MTIRRTHCRAILAGLILLSTCVPLRPALPQSSSRTLIGQVVDRQHEPLRGAVVLLQQDGSASVTSYLTDKDGNFSFKRLSTGADYKVTATYRGKTCKPKEISHFDSKLVDSVVFVINLD